MSGALRLSFSRPGNFSLAQRRLERLPRPVNAVHRRTAETPFLARLHRRFMPRRRRCRLAKRSTVTACNSTAYNAPATHGKVSTCQNGIDSKLQPHDSRFRVIDRTLQVHDSELRIVDSKFRFLKFEISNCRIETSRRRFEVSNRQLRISNR